MSGKGTIDIELEGSIFEALKLLKDNFKSLEDKIEDVEETGKKGFDGVGKAMSMLNFNAITEGLGNLSESLSFTNEIGTLKNDIARLTDASGDELDQMTRDAYRLSEVWEVSAEEIARSANTMTKTIGGSFESNMALIEQGFEKGANANGDMLRQLQEYGPFVKQLGLDASETIAFIASATKDGVFDDKAMDALKEANLSLREMGQGQIDALTGIGIKSTDLIGKTTFESVKMISAAMQTADTQARQLVLADIFKGAGEDSGLAFIEGLGTMDLDINNLPSVKTFGTTFTSWLAGIKVDIFEFAGDSAAYLQPITDLTRTFSTFLPVLKSTGTMFKWLGKTKLVNAGITKAVTAAQWLWNTALSANPIGLVIIAVAALAAGVYALTKAMDSSSEAEAANAEIREEVTSEMAKETAQLDILFRQLKATSPGTEERITQVEKMKEQYPGLLDQYDLEIAKSGKLNLAQQELIKTIGKQVEAKIKMKKAEQLLTEVEEAKDDGTSILDENAWTKKEREKLKWDRIRAKKKAAYDLIAEVQASKPDLPNPPADVPPPVDQVLDGFGKDPAKNKDKIKGKTNPFGSKFSGAGKQMKSLIVNIDNLVGNLTITQANKAETTSAIKNMVSEALTGAVRDFETSM